MDNGFEYWKSEYDKYTKQMKELYKLQSQALINIQKLCKHENLVPVTNEYYEEDTYKKCTVCGAILE
jgi:hypothetical protein